MYNDEFFLKRAFELAKLGKFTTSPNPNVGCVIVRNGIIVGEGFHNHVGAPHAEIAALNMAKDAAIGATAYITLEPCSHKGYTPPCVNALISAGISCVVSTINDPNPKVSGKGFNKLKNAGIIVRKGFMINEAEYINAGFLKRMRTGLPFVRLKIAASIDGRTAMSSGESKWITSSESKKDVHSFRAESDAILSTSATVLYDNPFLNLRWIELPKKIKKIYPIEKVRQPIRIIIDCSNRINTNYHVINEKGKVWLIRIIKDELKWPDKVSQIIIPYNDNVSKRINLLKLMIKLGSKNINSIWVEAGAELAGSLILANLVDELIIYQAPKILGSDAKPLCKIIGLNNIKNALLFNIFDICKLGKDIRLSLRPIKKNQ